MLLSGSGGERINDPRDLAPLRVAAVEGSSGMELAERRQFRIVATESLEQGVAAMLDQRADALVFVDSALRYQLKLNPGLALQMAPFALAEETYGFVLRWDNLRTPWMLRFCSCNARGR